MFLTHLHSDHTTDFSDLVTTNWVTMPVDTPLKVTGPVGTERYAALIVASLGADIGYRLAHHEDLTAPPRISVTEVTEGLAYEFGDVRVTCAPVHHFPSIPPSDTGSRPKARPLSSLAIPARATTLTGSAPAPLSMSRRSYARIS